MSTLHVVRVFCAEGGGGGNPLGVFLDGSEVPAERRQGVATDLGFSETVFVDDSGHGEIRIFTPADELPFAGHPCVGTAWLLARERAASGTLRPPAGEVSVRTEGELTLIGARAEWCPPFELRELGSAAAVTAMAPAETGLVYAWAWADRDAGEVRARSFCPDEGIAEDEATGAAAIKLCAELDRPLRITQGEGSRLIARPLEGGFTEVGGTVELDEVRDAV